MERFASIISSTLIPVPDNWSKITLDMSSFSASILRTSLDQFLFKIPYIHITISCSINSKSWRGSYEPGSTGCPSAFVDPEASMTCIKTLACIKSSKNLLPNPFPS